MATNHSNQTSTVKEDFQSLQGDTWSIDNLLYLVQYNSTTILPDHLILDDYRKYLENEDFLETIELEKKYWYSPQMFANDYYGTPDLDFLVMYFSKIDTLFDFDKKKITVLKKERLKDINRIIVKHKDEIRDNHENPPIYTK